jgi:MFS superfamily sulfate permease-like transporter
MYILIAAGIGIIIGFPFLKKVVPFLKKVPESFVAIVLITAYALIFRSDVTRIGDMGSVSASFQYVGYVFSHISGIFTGECFLTILPTAASLAFVGLIESMLTSRMVDDETKTVSNKNRECRAQGIGNMVCGMVGAMPGCGMIAMTVTNLKAGGRGRLSQFVAGGLMAILLFTLSFFMASIPLAALCAVMFVVVFHTINWDSILHVAKIPIKETVVMALTAIIVIATDNLALGVGVGLALSAIFYLFHRFTNGYVQMGVSFGCLGAAIGTGISGLFGFTWGYAIAMVLCAIGVGLASMARNESGIAKLKVVSTVSLVLCIAVGVAAVAGASVGFEMGPWYALIEKAQSMGSSDTTLYVK